MALFTDNFTGTDNDLLTGRSGWTLTGLGDCELQVNASNQLKATGVGNAAVITHDTGGANHYAQCNVPNAANWAVVGADHLMLRVTDRNNLYAVNFDGSTWRTFKITGGTRSAMTSVAGTLTNGDVIKFEANGTTLTIYQNSGSILSATDGAHTTQTLVGLRGQYVAPTDPVYDDFEADVVGGAGPGLWSASVM